MISLSFSDELKWRGFFNQTTYKNIEILNKENKSFYLGVDPSADSMTIGNLAAVMLVKHFIKAGHKAYLLVGGATGMIGDPDGKKDERNLKTIDEINRNKLAIVEQYKQLLKSQDFTVVDNYDWFKNINYLDFLRTVGKHVPLNQMLSRDFIQSRLSTDGSGISYAEFSYALIQGYDFLHLNDKHNVSLQLCGADQWGNAVAGVDLIRRISGKQADIYSIPLVINKSTGVKFGKSEEGAIWLDSNKTSVYKFYQFWLNADDEGVIDYLKIYTMLGKEEIELIERKRDTNPSARDAQKALAREVTILVHGVERYNSVKRVTDVLFGNADFKTLDENDINGLSLEIPCSNINKTISEIFTETGITKSRGEAKRLIIAGAVAVNNKKINDDIIVKSCCLIRKGKNNFVLVR